MTKQTSLFQLMQEAELKPKDPNVKLAAVPRLSRQCKAIFDVLRGGGQIPAKTLSQVTHRFGARLYDLRQLGCGIDVIVDHKTGESWYQLTHKPEGL